MLYELTPLYYLYLYMYRLLERQFYIIFTTIKLNRYSLSLFQIEKTENQMQKKVKGKRDFFTVGILRE